MLKMCGCRKLSIFTLWKVGENSAGFEVSKVKMCTIREKYEAKSKSRRGTIPKKILSEGMDIL